MMVDVPNEPMLTLEEVAKRLGMKEAKLRKQVHLGHVQPAINRRGRMLFWLSSVKAELRIYQLENSDEESPK